MREFICKCGAYTYKYRATLINMVNYNKVICCKCGAEYWRLGNYRKKKNKSKIVTKKTKKEK